MAGKDSARLRALAVVLLALVVQRVAYHSLYLAEDPFALATFSDGRLYERAADDIVGHPPLGEHPFYLQGVYAYVLAAGMAFRPGPTMGLLLQLVIVGVSLVAFHRACGRVYGRWTGGLCTVVLLAYPGLSFYENKYLTAALAESSLALMLAALAWAMQDGRARAAVAFGAATGLAVLARGNMLLGLPAFGWAMVLVGRHHHGGRSRSTVGAWALGLLLALGPMALRNAVVTGRATVMPAHGGGTSFYIGNNAEATGLWNDAGGLLSGDVGRERDELVQRLAIGEGGEAEQAAAIGRALYRRAWDEIAADPGRWVALEGRKLWFVTGNDELSQDYDLLGENELLGWWREPGVPLPVLLGLALVGIWALRSPAPSDDTPQRDDTPRGKDADGNDADGKDADGKDADGNDAVLGGAQGRGARASEASEGGELGLAPWAWTLGGMAVAVVGANLLFFTSAQHRVPLAVVAAALAGPGLAWLARGIATRRRAAAIGLLVVLAVALQGLVPRVPVHRHASAAHYHNLALVQVEIGQPRAAVQTLGRALALQPDHPVILIERASLQRKLGQLDGASTDLDHLRRQPDVPDWIAARLDEEQRRVDSLRGLRRRPRSR